MSNRYLRILNLKSTYHFINKQMATIFCKKTENRLQGKGKDNTNKFNVNTVLNLFYKATLKNTRLDADL